MEEMIQERVSQKENELNATYDERLRNYEERCVLFLTPFPNTNRTMGIQGTRPPTPNITDQNPTTRSAHVE